MKVRLFLKRLFFVILVIFLLLVGSFAYFELNKEKLLAEFKAFIQEQVLKSTGRAITFSDIKGGIISGITLNKLVISQADKNNNLAPVFKTEELVLNYSYWDIILGRFDRLKYIRLNSPVLYLNGSWLNSPARQGNLGFQLVSLFSWVKGKGEISFSLDNGSLALNDEHNLISHLYGKILLDKNSFKCPWLRGYIYGNEINLSGAVMKLSEPAPQIDLVLKSDGYLAKGFCRLEDSLAEPTLIGAFNFKGDRKLDFSGKLLFEQSGLNFKDFLVNNRHILNANVNFSKKDGYLTLEDENKNNILEATLSLYSDFSFLNQIKLNHITLLGHDILTNIIVMGNWPSEEAKTFSGYLASSGTIIDYAPANELEVILKITGKTFTLDSFKLGDSYTLSGSAGLSYPYPLDLDLTVTRGQVSDLFIFAKNKKETILGGRFDGQIKLRGTLPNDLELNGHLEGHNGNIGTLKYETANINLKGSGLVIYVDGSRIFRPEEGKYLTLDGFIDLAKLGSGNPLQNLKISSDEKTIIWHEWDITKKPEETKLSFQKDVGSEFKVGFDTFINDETENSLKKDKSGVEVQYNLSQNQSIKLKLKENEEIVGVEHKIEF